MEAAQYFQNLALAAYVDGEIVPAELELLERHAENMGLSSEVAQSVLNRVAAGELTQWVKPKSKEARLACFRAVVRIMRSDKKLRRKEQKMIRLLGVKMEIDAQIVEDALSPGGLR